MRVVGLAFVAVGMFSLACAVKDWDWFMNTKRARVIAAILSRKGARIFYGLLGVGCLVFGGLLTSGMIEVTP